MCHLVHFSFFLEATSSYFRSSSPPEYVLIATRQFWAALDYTVSLLPGRSRMLQSFYAVSTLSVVPESLLTQTSIAFQKPCTGIKADFVFWPLVSVTVPREVVVQRSSHAEFSQHFTHTGAFIFQKNLGIMALFILFLSLWVVVCMRNAHKASLLSFTYVC